MVLRAKGTPGWNTPVRLRNRPYDPWLDEFCMRSDRHGMRESRVRATPNARRHYEIHAACYRELYPDIACPDPTATAHVTHEGLADHRIRTPKHLLADTDVRILSELVRLTGDRTCYLQRRLIEDYDRLGEPVPEDVATLRPGLLRSQVKDLARTDKPVTTLTGRELAELIEVPDSPFHSRPLKLTLLVLTEQGVEHYAQHHQQLYPDLHLAPSPATTGHEG